MQILAKYAIPISADSQGENLPVVPTTKEEEKPLSEWEFVKGYFGKLHVLLALLSLTVVLLHICFAPPTFETTLIRWGFDLPDSVSELLFAAIVVLQVERVVIMVQQFLRARYWQCKLLKKPLGPSLANRSHSDPFLYDALLLWIARLILRD